MNVTHIGNGHLGSDDEADRPSSGQGWTERERRHVASEMRAALDERRWDDFGELTDDYFHAISAVDPGVLADAWERVPRDWLAAHPRQQLAAAMTRARERSSGAPDEHSVRAYTRWVLGQEHPAVRDTLVMLALDLRQHLVRGRIARAAAAADDAEHTLRRADDLRGLDDVMPMIHREVGFARLASGDLIRAGAVFADGWRWSGNAIPHPAAPALAACAAVVHALGEDHVRAAAWLTRSAIPGARASTTTDAQFAAGVARALIAVGGLDRDGAEAALSDLDGRGRGHDLAWVLAHARARAALLWGDPRRALADIDDERDSSPLVTPPTSFAGAVLRADAAELHYSLGEAADAARLVETMGYDVVHPAAVPAAVRTHLILGRVDEADALLARTEWSRTTSLPGAARRAVLRANIAHVGHRADRVRLLDEAVELLARTGALDAAYDALAPVFSAIVQRMPHVASVGARLLTPAAAVLTPREDQVLGLLAANASVQEIASAMYVSRNTVKTHLRALYRKLGVSNRADALDIGRRFLHRDYEGVIFEPPKGDLGS